MNHKRPKGNQFHNQFHIPLNKKGNNVIDINNNKICQDSVTSARTRHDSSIRNLTLTVPGGPPLLCGNAAARADWPPLGGGGKWEAHAMGGVGKA